MYLPSWSACALCRGGFSFCGAWALECMGLVAVTHGLSSMRVFLDRDWTCVPWTDRQILNHWTIREVLISYFLFIKLMALMYQRSEMRDWAVKSILRDLESKWMRELDENAGVGRSPWHWCPAGPWVPPGPFTSALYSPHPNPAWKLLLVLLIDQPLLFLHLIAYTYYC